MTLSHDDANARLLDLVYGEAAPVERAALEAHVATCARCTADLAALGATHARARVALDDGDADVPVPARVHARLLAAATQAAVPRAALVPPFGKVASPPMAAAPMRVVEPPAAPSLWERLRGKWTLPTFATLGAVAVVVLASKLFLEPQRTMERGREVAGATAPPPAPATAAAPVLAKGAPPPPEGEGPAEAQPRHFGTGALGGLAGASRHAHGPGAPPGLFDVASPRPARLRGAGGSASALDGLGAGSPAKPSPETPSAEGYASPPSGWKGSAAGPADKAKARDVPSGAMAPAPPPAPAAAPKNEVSPNDVLARDRAVDEEAASGAAAGSRAAAAQPSKKKSAASDEPRRSAPAQATRAPSAKEAEPKLEDLEESAEKDDAVGTRNDASSREALVRRADRLYATRRWSEAVAAYRDLLRRFPDAELTARWRARLTQAERSQATPEAAPAAK